MIRTRLVTSAFWLYLGVVVTFLFAPLIFVVLFSLNKTASLTFPFHGFSIRWYRAALNSPAVSDSIMNSLRIAGITVAVVSVVGTLAAIGLTRPGFRHGGAIRVMLLAPAALPGLFIGIALLTFFVAMHIQLSLWTVITGHLIFTLPYFVLVASTRLARFDPLLGEAAQDLGAGPWLTFRRVTFPIIAPALFGAALVVFSLSWDEVLITFFTIGNQNTLPLVIYASVRHSVTPMVNAISTLLLAGSILTIFVARSVVVAVSR